MGTKRNIVCIGCLALIGTLFIVGYAFLRDSGDSPIPSQAMSDANEKCQAIRRMEWNEEKWEFTDWVFAKRDLNDCTRREMANINGVTDGFLR